MEISLLPISAGVELYRRQAARLYEAYLMKDAAVVEFVREHHPRLRKWVEEDCPYMSVTPADIQLAMADWYYFETWMHMVEWVMEVTQKESTVFQFESAVEAIFTGDAARLEALLRENPGLTKMRSMRRHHATLLHYIGANGVEYYRGQYPPNMADLLRLLLEAGSAVDACADMYGGGSTTLGLVATSIHPVRAGVMVPLLSGLLDAGATLDAQGTAGNGHSVVRGCLYNGRPEAADYLARRGAKLGLEEAAGVGRLDIVRSYFNENGSLKDPDKRQEMELGLIWACAYGQTAVAEFLIDRGGDPGKPVDGMNGVHWAAIGGHLDTIRLLIGRNVSLETVNRYGGTALGSAFWAMVNGNEVNRWPEDTDDVMVIETLVSAGARIEPGTLGWLDRQNLPVAKKAMIGDLLRHHGAEN